MLNNWMNPGVTYFVWKHRLWPVRLLQHAPHLTCIRRGKDLQMRLRSKVSNIANASTYYIVDGRPLVLQSSWFSTRWRLIVDVRRHVRQISPCNSLAGSVYTCADHWHIFFNPPDGNRHPNVHGARSIGNQLSKLYCQYHLCVPSVRSS